VKFRLFHIPEKSQVFASKYYVDIYRDIELMGLECIPLLHTCEWLTSMYHKHDEHPNQSSYANLVDCITGKIYKPNS